MESQRLEGTVKSYKGSFGWIDCTEVKEKYGKDTFLHKNDLNAVPAVGSTVSFRLVFDAKGNPKAADATVQAAPAESVQAVGRRGPEALRRAALMLFRGDEVLVLKEAKEGEEAKWSDLGGKVEDGELALDCALRELKEESMGFLSNDSLELLSRGLRQRYGDGKEKPELIALGSGNNVAIFLLDCTGVELPLLQLEKANAHGVLELRWLSRFHPELKDRQLTRWPLLRALCVLGSSRKERPQETVSEAPRERSRSPRQRDPGPPAPETVVD